MVNGLACDGNQSGICDKSRVIVNDVVGVSRL